MKESETHQAHNVRKTKVGHTEKGLHSPEGFQQDAKFLGTAKGKNWDENLQVDDLRVCETPTAWEQHCSVASQQGPQLTLAFCLYFPTEASQNGWQDHSRSR